MADLKIPLHFDSLYPEGSRFEEIEKILSFIKEGKSIQLISVPGTGRSNLLRFLAYNHNIRFNHLGENQKWFHFVYLNFSEVKDKSLFDVNKFILLSLADSLKDRQMINEHDKIHEIFKDHFEFKDELVLFQGLKEAIDYLAIEKELNVIFLFDQFERYLSSLTTEFFENLRVLRNRAKYRFSVVFSLTRPLEELVEEQTFSPFSEFLIGNYVFLNLLDKDGLDFRFSHLEKITGKKLKKELVEKILLLTGGHGKLSKLSSEISLSETLTENVDIKEFTKILLSKKVIIDALMEIWGSLTPFEQNDLVDKKNNQFLTDLGLLKNNQIVIPLLTNFIKNKNKRMTREEISFNENGEIKKGEQTISNKLTSLEFKLLAFLMKNKDRILSREEIIKDVWSETQSTAGVTDQAIDQLVSRLRRKIEEDPNNPVYIETVKGRGIKFSN